MAAQTQDKATSGTGWRSRAGFKAGKTRRQRQKQFRQQVNALGAVLIVTVVLSVVFVIANWRNVSAVKALSCEAFPQFCVPLAGESLVFESLEAADVRILDQASQGIEGVVRYVGALDEPRLGDPGAPVHFITVSDFACPHCQDYHAGDLPRFIEDYVLTGQATLGFALSTWTGGGFSEVASQAALCAGEQGAFWELSEELFHVAESRNIGEAFTLSNIRNMVRDMGLDSREIERCVTSGRYINVLNEYRNFAYDNGVSGTPTVLVSYGNSNEWAIISRGYDTLVQATKAANAQTQ